MTNRTATGTLTVEMLPTETRAPGRFVLLRLDEQSQGGLAGTSDVEMLAHG